MMAINVTGSILCAREAVKRDVDENTAARAASSSISVLGRGQARPRRNTYVDYAASKGCRSDIQFTNRPRP